MLTHLMLLFIREGCSELRDAEFLTSCSSFASENPALSKRNLDMGKQKLQTINGYLF